MLIKDSQKRPMSLTHIDKGTVYVCNVPTSQSLTSLNKLKIISISLYYTLENTCTFQEWYGKNQDYADLSLDIHPSVNKNTKQLVDCFFIILATSGKTCIRSYFPKKIVKSKMQFDIVREALINWQTQRILFLKVGRRSYQTPPLTSTEMFQSHVIEQMTKKYRS